MSKSAGTTRTVSSTSVPSVQLPYLLFGLQQAKTQYDQGPPEFYPGSTVADFTPAEELAQQYLQQQAGTMAQLGEGAIPTLNFLLQAYDVDKNPYIKSAVQGAIQPVMQQLREQALPAIRSGAVAAGGYGGTRQALAEGLAMQRAAQEMGNISSQMYNRAYETGLQAALSGIGAIPTIQQALAYPGQVLGAVGAQQRALDQAKINADIARFQWNQLAPRLALQEYMRLVGIPLGGETSTVVEGSAPGAAAQWASFGLSLLPYLGHLFGWW
jgi:hypothetical protein